MMGKKKINIVLIIIVLGLWGTVAYKTVAQFFFPETLVVNENISNNGFNLDEVNKDTFQLKKVTRDPFLNTQNKSIDSILKKDYSKIPIKKIKSSAIVVRPKEITNWPSIFYYGYIKSKSKDEELVLVKIDEKLYKLRKYDQVREIILKQIYNDSIELNYNKQKRIIRINSK